MFRLATVSLFLMGLLLTTSSAQDKDKDEKGKGVDPPVKKEYPPVGTGVKGAKTAAIPGDCEIHFLNGSKVRMVVQSEKLEIATAYGKLSVPVKDVRAIEFGLHFADGVEDQIMLAVKNLGSTDYRERQKADKALIDLGPFSYPALLEASVTKELEVSKRAKEIIQKLRAQHPKKDLKTNVEDKVITQNFTIVGRILTSTIKSKSEYFGDQELSLSKMRTLRAFGVASMDLDLVLDSGKYANQGQWMETDFLCDGRSAIVVTAKGMIDVWPQQGGQFMSNPNGFQVTRNGGNPGGVVVAGRKIGAVNLQQHCGMLLGKFGEDGEPFILGERYDGIPDREGKLYLHIGPSQWNAQCIGNYEVKISRKND